MSTIVRSARCTPVSEVSELTVWLREPLELPSCTIPEVLPEPRFKAALTEIRLSEPPPRMRRPLAAVVAPA